MTPPFCSAKFWALPKIAQGLAFRLFSFHGDRPFELDTERWGMSMYFPPRTPEYISQGLVLLKSAGIVCFYRNPNGGPMAYFQAFENLYRSLVSGPFDNAAKPWIKPFWVTKTAIRKTIVPGEIANGAISKETSGCKLCWRRNQKSLRYLIRMGPMGRPDLMPESNEEGHAKDEGTPDEARVVQGDKRCP